MIRRLLLVRHGRIEAGHQGQFIGATDPALDALGESQVRALAGRVQHFHPEICYCSPLRRCRQTASALVPDLPTRFEPRLREIDFGQWERRTFEDVAGEYPAQVAQWAEFAPEFTFPGGENLADFVQRVRGAAELLCYTDARTVLAITHGGVIRLMLCHLLGLDLRKYVVFDVGYASLAVIDVFEDGGVLTALERVEVETSWSVTTVAKMVLVTGGCRSGKSAYAQRLAESLPSRRLFVATCPVTDEELRLRIETHQQARRDRGWETVEEQVELAPVFRRHAEYEVVLVDCLTLWVNNLMYYAEQAGRQVGEEDVAVACHELLAAARQRRGTVIFVTNEVGLGVVPDNAVARRYRDLVGRANQTIAAEAETVTLVTCGIPWHLKAT